MSTLKAARADNFYHPPEWDPRKSSRAELTAGPGWRSHPLRERAKKLDEGILVIRFEMPFDVRCAGCDNRIAKGVRFNAEKKCVGRYLSSKIWSFRFLCHAEDSTARTDRRRNPHFIEIRTDPKEGDYVVHEGATRVSQTSATAEQLGVEAVVDPEERARRDADPFYKLEAARSGQQAQRVARTLGPRVEELRQMRDDRWRDDYAASQLLRSQHRAARKEELLRSASSQAKGIRVALPAQSAAQAAEDSAIAAAVHFTAKRKRTDAACGEKRLRLLSGSIFEPKSVAGQRVAEEKISSLRLRKARTMKVVSRPAAIPKAQTARLNVVKAAGSQASESRTGSQAGARGTEVDAGVHGACSGPGVASPGTCTSSMSSSPMVAFPSGTTDACVVQNLVGYDIDSAEDEALG